MAEQQVDLKTIPVSPEGEHEETPAVDMDDKLVTVFHDKDNFNVKHPLQNKWTLWFTKPSSGKVCSSFNIWLVAVCIMYQIKN